VSGVVDRILSGAGTVLTAIVYVFILAPIVVLVFSSFDTAPFFSFPPRGYSLHWYAAAWHSAEYRDALGVSLVLAATATLVSVPAGTAAAYALARARWRGRTLAQALLLSPLALPLVVWAIELMQLYARIGLSGSMLGLALAHTVIVLPFPVRIMLASFSRIDPTLEQAARTLGASSVRAFLRVDLPLAAPGIVISVAFAFLTSFNDVVVSSFIAGARSLTFQVRLYSQLRSQGVDPITLAIGAVLAAAIVLAAIVGERLFGWSRHV
jgi:putative spermidine/putrescine transport system permease protein